MKSIRKLFLTLSFITLTSISMFAQTAVPVTGGWSLAGNNISSTSSSILGTKNEYPIYIKTNNVNRMIIDTDGNVGIGTEQPRQMLHVVGGNIMISKSSTKASGSVNGSLYFGGDINNNNPHGKWGIEYLDYDGIYGLNFWQPYSVGSTTQNYVLFLSDNGNIGIGTSNPQAKLAVDGSILAKSVKVNTSSSYWPDYVFSQDYELMNLKDLENYIYKNQHLPGIISAKEVEMQGNVDIGEINAKLLEKIEELTLYIIDLQEQINKQQKQINELKTK